MRIQRHSLPRGLQVVVMLFAVVAAAGGCTKNEEGTHKTSVDPGEQGKSPIDYAFSGEFRNIATVDGQQVETELDLSDEGIQQRRNGFVVYDAPCQKSLSSTTRADFRCTLDKGQETLWPLAFTRNGELYHLAMPKMRYKRVTSGQDDAAKALDAPETPPDTPR